jgi:hypothetical protein
MTTTPSNPAFKVGDKIRYYSPYWGQWKYTEVTRITADGFLWGRWAVEGGKLPTTETYCNPSKYQIEMVVQADPYAEDPDSWV